VAAISLEVIYEAIGSIKIFNKENRNISEGHLVEGNVTKLAGIGRRPRWC
jgi:hypothetical protein